MFLFRPFALFFPRPPRLEWSFKLDIVSNAYVLSTTQINSIMDKITKYSAKCPAPSGFKNAQPAIITPVANGIFGTKNLLTGLFNVVRAAGCTVKVLNCKTNPGKEEELPNFTIPPKPVKKRKEFI